MRLYLKMFLLLASFFGAVHAQENDKTVLNYVDLKARITEETDFRYYYLLHDVFPDVKTDFLEPQKNSASRSIRLRKLFGKGFSKLNGRRKIFITRAQWFRGANNRKYLAVLFAAILPEDAPRDRSDAKGFYALAVFAYVRRKVPDWNVYNALGYKWTYEFDFVDAVAPQSDSDVELPKDLPVVKNGRGDEETFWLLNSHTEAGDTVR